jgi:hypothetical protein
MNVGEISDRKTSSPQVKSRSGIRPFGKNPAAVMQEQLSEDIRSHPEGASGRGDS